MLSSKLWQSANIKHCLLVANYAFRYWFFYMKPSIADAVDSLVQQGVEHIIAIVTAPFFTALVPELMKTSAISHFKI